MCWNHWGVRDSWELERERSTLSVRRVDENVRVSDADREAVVAKLSHHTGEGRLTLEEFEARIDEVWKAKTRADLQSALRELPVDRDEHRRSSWEPQIRFAVFLAVIAFVTIAPAILWWLIPVAFFTVWRPGHHHHRSHREPARDELISV